MPLGVSNKFLDNLRKRIREFFGGGDEEPHIEEDTKLRGPASGHAAIMYRIRVAARKRRLLWMQYQPPGKSATWRHVEPYSFRYTNKGTQPLFFGWCGMHDEIHSFRVDRIKDIHVTDRPFAPRLDIEIT